MGETLWSNRYLKTETEKEFAVELMRQHIRRLRHRIDAERITVYHYGKSTYVSYLDHIAELFTEVGSFSDLVLEPNGDLTIYNYYRNGRLQDEIKFFNQCTSLYVKPLGFIVRDALL